MEISIDKIKLKGCFGKVQGGQSFYDYMSSLSNVHVTEVTHSTALNRYSTSFTCYPIVDGKVDEGAFYVAFGFNGDYQCQRALPLHFVVEFNPNKCPIRFYQDFIYLTSACIKEVVSLDLAFDFPVPRHNVLIVRGAMNEMAFLSRGSCTEYIGYSEKHGRLKLYDKALERGYDYNLTRVEVTISKGLPFLSAIKSQKLHSFTSYDFEMLQVVSDHLARVYFFDDASPVAPLIRLLAMSSPVERDIYLNSFQPSRRSELRKALRESLTAIELSPFELASLILEKVGEIV